MAARYWRISGLQTASGNLALEALALSDGSTDYAAGTLTGGLSPGFKINWDLGSDINITQLKLTPTVQADWPYSLLIEKLNPDGVWGLVEILEVIIYPGDATAVTAWGGTGGTPVLTPTTWDAVNKGSACTLSAGDLTATGAQSKGTARTAVSVSTGKWYWEITSNGARYPLVGVGSASATLGNYPGSDANGWGYYGLGAKKYHAGAASAYGSIWNNTSHVIGFALDADAGTLEVYKNGTSMGVMFTGMVGPYFAMTGGDTNSSSSNCTANFGAAVFAHTVPSGFTPGFGTVTGANTAITPLVIGAKAQPSGVTNIADDAMPTAGVTMAGGGVVNLDTIDGGTHRVAGTVAEKALPTNTPLVRKVMLIDERSHRVVRETWSDAAGNYVFNSINANTTYTVISYDHTSQYRAVIADNILPDQL